MSCLFTTIPGNDCQVALYIHVIQAQNSDKHHAVRDSNVMGLVSWLVGWILVHPLS